jgi:hypothetical protein
VTGNMLVYGMKNGTRTDFEDGEFLLQIVPKIDSLKVESVASDGSNATVLIAGSGFVEGGNSEYHFGDVVVTDAGSNSGPEVFGRYDNATGQYIESGYVRVKVPLTNGVFGAVSIKTAGGASALYNVEISSIESVAYSGTPTDASQASANAGQAIVLHGSGLSTATDVLMRYTDLSGNLQMVKLNPDSASNDGTRATLIVPGYANGAFTLQVIGSASQPLLQIVPTLKGYDQQSRLVLFGSGFVEGAGTYHLAGNDVSDNAIDGNIDVYYNADFSLQNGSAYLNTAALPRHGMGNVTVTTAGGTSAALSLNSVLPGTASGPVGALGDVAVDPSNGGLWTSDGANPGHLLRIDAATGKVLQSITLTNDAGSTYLFNNAGLQVLGAPMTLGSTSVPAGSLLVFNGNPSPDRVVAINPATGAVIASLALADNADLTAGLYDPATNSIFVTEQNGPGTRLLRYNVATGALVQAVTLPLNVSYQAGLAVDPVSGNLWVGGYYNGNQLIELRRDGTEVRRISLASQGVNDNEITGLAFAPDGKLMVASTQGVIYRVDTTAA